MAEDENDEVPKLPPDARLDSLDKRLDRLQQEEAKRTAKPQPIRVIRPASWSSASSSAARWRRIVGWLLDRWFGTRPWLMLVMLFLGFAVGIWNVIRISSKPPGARLAANRNREAKWRPKAKSTRCTSS